MIKVVEYYDGTILNLSGVMANPQYTNKCTWLARANAREVRALWDFPTDREYTHTELVERAHQLVELAKKEEGVSAVWIRPMKCAPFFYSYLEDAFLTNGFAVVLPAEERDDSVKTQHKFRVDGWWVIPPFTEDELEG